VRKVERRHCAIGQLPVVALQRITRRVVHRVAKYTGDVATCVVPRTEERTCGLERCRRRPENDRVVTLAKHDLADFHARVPHVTLEPVLGPEHEIPGEALDAPQ
jgi:hypothetical protein